jgi:NIMA-interacting peptidyl-prolyl cis-trans isomerase 1
MARRFSDCSSGLKSGGDLGFVYPNQLQFEFEEAAFSLDLGEISMPVWTDSGVHIILRTA